MQSATPPSRFAIVTALFNRPITEKLLAGARAEFARQGADDSRIDCFEVPGAFELPMICGKLAAGKNYAAVIALGAVIRGETAHFDFVAGECARGIAQLNLQNDTPIIFGVLTTETVEQAMTRAEPTRKDKGGEAVRAALQMARLMRQLRGGNDGE